MTRFRKTLRNLWITFGILFSLWMVNSFRAQGFDRSILASDSGVSIEETSRFISFRPAETPQPTALIFLPGGMVQPEAYAPMSRVIAENGFTVFVVKLPFGSAPLAPQEASVMEQTLALMNDNGPIENWVIGGHSRGAAIASRFAALHAGTFDGLILIGTSHPKEAAFDLSDSTLDITKVYASNDGLASVEEVQSNAVYLPEDTNWVLIDGGNHSQFGYYGAQLGDSSATISREQQQELMVNAILIALNRVQDR